MKSRALQCIKQSNHSYRTKEQNPFLTAVYSPNYSPPTTTAPPAKMTIMENDRRKSSFAVAGVASVALEAEIDECHHRLLSGEVVMNTAHSDSWGKRSTSR